MAYCTVSDILDLISEDELVQLTDDEGTGEMDTAVVDKAITNADAEIDGYCGKRYSVPLLPVPPVICKLSVDVAIYNLFSRRQGAPEDRRTRYKDAIKFLENVAKGLVSLGEDDPDTPPSSSHKPQMTQSDPVFSRESLKGW